TVSPPWNASRASPPTTGTRSTSSPCRGWPPTRWCRASSPGPPRPHKPGPTPRPPPRGPSAPPSGPTSTRSWAAPRRADLDRRDLRARLGKKGAGLVVACADVLADTARLDEEEDPSVLRV